MNHLLSSLIDLNPRTKIYREMDETVMVPSDPEEMVIVENDRNITYEPSMLEPRPTIVSQKSARWNQHGLNLPMMLIYLCFRCIRTKVQWKNQSRMRLSVMK